MIIKTLFLNLLERPEAPLAKIFVKIVSNSEKDFKSKPFIFILPGGPGANHSHYEDYSCLSTRGNIVFFDPRGCGLSSKDDPSTYTMDNYIDDIEIIRQLLNLNEIILLGKSYGAMAAVGFTLRHPSVVSQLILSAGAASFKFLETAKSNVLTRGSLEQQKACATLWQGAFSSDEEAADFLKTMASLYSYRIKLGLPVLSRPAPTYPLAHEALNQGFGGFLREFSFEEQLVSIKCQTLILAGEEDWITDKIHSQSMAEKIPHSNLVIFSESSHMMEIDVPELYFNTIREFIAFNPKE